MEVSVVISIFLAGVLGCNTSLEANLRTTHASSFFSRCKHLQLTTPSRLSASQVEYMPCCRVADGLAMIDALIPSINEDRGFVSTSDLRDALVFGTGPQFTVQHTALQITDLFNKVFA